jgi:hypothetical protein
LPIGNFLSVRLDNRSWMTGDCHVQFSESAKVRFPRATQHFKFEPAGEKTLDIFMRIINERWQQTINQLSCPALAQRMMKIFGYLPAFACKHGQFIV